MKTACLLFLLSLAGCASAPQEDEPREPPRIERCDAFGCCEDDFGRSRCCDTRRDPSCDRRNDPYWRQDRRQDERRSSPLPPLPPLPLPGKGGLPRL